MALLSQTALRLDPVLSHNFVISLIDTSSTLSTLGSLALSAVFDVAVGGFTECSGLEMTMQPEEYKEGGRNGTVLKFPSRITWANITLKRGVGASTALWDWHYGFVEGRGRRRDGVIILLNDLHVPNNIWSFRRGLPVKYTGPSMNAGQNSVAIEAIEIAHEGIYQVPFVGLSAAAGTTGAGLAV
jgi:phage tail-like protein